jgi:hypothetical protein
MALADIAGVLSRRFIVGFFVPVFFGLVALKLLVARAAVPSDLRHAGGGTQILILGGVALLLGLLLWGVHFSLIRFLEGYWLIAPDPPAPTYLSNEKPGALASALRAAQTGVARVYRRTRQRLGQRMRKRWIGTRRTLLNTKAQENPSDERTRAAGDLTLRFPPDDELVLPTELGNVIRAFETHPRERYGLDGIRIWPRVATMLSESERAEIEDTTTDLALWVNGLAVVVVAGVLLFAERLWHNPGGALATFGVELALVIAVSALAHAFYRQAILAALRWGEPVRAAFDVHRLPLYDALGMRRPLNPAEDVASGKLVGRLLAFAEPLPEEWRAKPAATHGSNEGGNE